MSGSTEPGKDGIRRDLTSKLSVEKKSHSKMLEGQEKVLLFEIFGNWWVVCDETGGDNKVMRFACDKQLSSELLEWWQNGDCPVDLAKLETDQLVRRPPQLERHHGEASVARINKSPCTDALCGDLLNDIVSVKPGLEG